MQLEWKTHPAGREPQKVLLIAAVCMVTCAATYISLGSLFLALLSFVVLLLAVTPFIFPTTYVVDRKGISERRLGTVRQRHWKDIARVDSGKNWLLVSPFSTPRWLDKYRGLVVWTEGTSHEELKSMIEAQIESHA